MSTYQMNANEVAELKRFTFAAIVASGHTLTPECTSDWHCKLAAKGTTWHAPAVDDEPEQVFTTKYAAVFYLNGWTFIDQTKTFAEPVAMEAEDLVTESEDEDAAEDPNRWNCPVCGQDRPALTAYECSSCKKCTHTACMSNPPSACPSGIWLCNACVNTTAEDQQLVAAEETIDTSNKVFCRIHRNMATIDRKLAALLAKETTVIEEVVDTPVVPKQEDKASTSTAVTVRGSMDMQTEMTSMSLECLCDKLLIPYNFVAPDAACKNWISRAERQAIYSDLLELYVCMWVWFDKSGFKDKLHRHVFDTVINTSPFALVKFQISLLIDKAPELAGIKAEVQSVMSKFGGGTTCLASRNIIDFDVQMEETDEEEQDEETKQFVEHDCPIIGHKFYAAAVDYMEGFHIIVSVLLIDALSDASRCSTLAGAQEVIARSLSADGPVGLCLGHGRKFRVQNSVIVNNFVVMMNVNTGMTIATV